MNLKYTFITSIKMIYYKINMDNIAHEITFTNIKRSFIGRGR